MNYVKCVACPSAAQCDEEGQCVNTLVTHQYGAILRFARPPAAGTVVNVPPLASDPLMCGVGYSGAPSSKPAKAPPSAPRAPGGGTVTDVIFAECEAQLADMHRSGKSAAFAERGQLFQEARKRAIPVLEARGVNINSARKGSSMWIASRR